MIDNVKIEDDEMFPTRYSDTVQQYLGFHKIQSTGE